jgi:hypothetical protein
MSSCLKANELGDPRTLGALCVASRPTSVYKKELLPFRSRRHLQSTHSLPHTTLNLLLIKDGPNQPPEQPTAIPCTKWLSIKRGYRHHIWDHHRFSNRHWRCHYLATASEKPKSTATVKYRSLCRNASRFWQFGDNTSRRRRHIKRRRWISSRFE